MIRTEHAAMGFQTTRLTLAALLVLCIASTLAFSHGPSAATDTVGLTVVEYAETTGGSGDDTTKTGELAASNPGIESPDRQKAGTPGIPLRVLQLRHHLTRFPILPQGPPHHA